MNNYRNKILELFDEGHVGKDELFVSLLNWLSESDAKEFWNEHYSDWFEDEDEDYEYDGQPTESQEWHDFDPDC